MQFHLKLFVITLLFVIPIVGLSQLSPVFIPNGGQWHENVLHKMSVENGDVYIEQDGLKFAFYDEEFFHHLHANEQPDSILKVHAFKINFVDCNTKAQITAHNKGSALYNYYIGKDQSKWVSGLTSSRELVYHDLYPNINLRVVSTLEGIKYEFVVLPGGNPKDIMLDIEGVNQVNLRGGALQILTSTRNVVDKAPYSYCGGKENEIKTKYALLDSVVTFEIMQSYDQEDTLIIDPDLVFSTYSGSTANNFGFTATYDDLGFLYSGSSVFEIGYPTTVGAYSVIFSSNPTGGNDIVWDPYFGWVNAGYTNTDVGLTKYDTSGTKLIYSTYLGGELCEVPHSIIVNSNDELLILGTTGSTNFPTTSETYDESFAGGPKVNLSRGIAVNYVNGSDIFVAKLSNDGTQLLASTYLGGSNNDGINERLNYNYADQMRGDIAVDTSGDVYISSCTYSNDLVSFNGAQSVNNGGSDGLVAKFSGDLKTLQWGTYLGGTNHDACYSLILDKNKDVIVAGGTASTDFITTPGVISQTFQGVPTDGFISKISNDGSTINASTYYGTHAYDQVYFVRIDDEENVYIYGQSASMDGSLISNAAYNSVNSGMFISKLSNDLSNVIWSTTFGSGTGEINLSPTAFAVDICNNIYLSGWGSPALGFSLIPNWILDPNGSVGHNGGRGTLGMDVTADAFQSTTNGNDFYLLVLDDDANTLQYASFYGGNQSNEHVDGGTSRFDRKGNIYQSVCAGCGGNDDFPIKPQPGAWSAVNNSSCNNGVFKFDFQIPAIVADFIVPDQGCLGTPYEFLNTSNELDSTTYFWSFGDDSTSTLKSPSHQYVQAGTYTIKLVIRDPVSCNLVDSISKIITLRNDSLILSKIDTSCSGDSLQIVLPGGQLDSTVYAWSPSDLFSDSTLYEPKVLTDSSLNLMLIVTNEPGCADTILYPVFVPDYELKLSDSQQCVGDTIVNYVMSDTSFVSYRWSTDTSFSDQLNNLPTDASFDYSVENVDTTFYLKIVDFNGCEFIDSIAITPINFELQLSADTTICDTIDIWGNIVNYSDEALDSIAWGPTSEVMQGSDSTFALLNLNYGLNEYQVYARDTFGCADVDTLQHFLRADSLSLVKIDTTCTGDSLQVALSVSFLDSSKYNWSPGHLFSDSTVNLPKVLVDTSVTFTLIVEQYPGCTDTVLNSVFVPSYELYLSDSITCMGDTIVNYVRSDPKFVAYQWSSTNDFNDQLNQSFSDTSFSYVVAEGDTIFYVRVADVNNCVFIDSLIVNGVNFEIEVNLDTIVCDTVAIWGNIISHQMNELDSIAWYPANKVYQGQDSISALLDIYAYLSEFQVYGRDTNGCVSRDSLKILDNSLNEDLNDTTICFGDTINLGYELTYNPLYSYEWIPDVVFDKDSIFTKAFLQDSIQIGLVINNGFCIDTVNQFISVNKISISSGLDTILCNNVSAILVGVTGEDSLKYLWSNSPLFTDTIQQGLGLNNYVFIPPVGENTYYVRAEDEFACVDTSQLKVTSSLYDLSYPVDSTLCLNDSMLLSPNEDISGLGTLNFAWSPSKVLHSDTSESTVLVYGNGQWIVKVISENQYGCGDTDLITLNFASLDTSLIKATVEPSTIVDNETTVIELLPVGYTYEISPEESETEQNGNKFTVLPKESKTYLLTVIDSLYGKCRNVTTVGIEVLKFVCDDPYIYVPNAFTPNGDGENDVLYVRGKNITKMYFAIFNRWGQKVFETEQQHIGWDGMYKGMQIDPAVYDYYLKYECVGEEEHFKKGNITLIR